METIRRNKDEQPPQPPPPPPPPPQKCPRCESSNTKFCYYNNYSLSQPRYFCKACRRYWTQGGTLRNVPIGGGSRKNKRSKATTTGANEVVRSQSLSSGQQQTLTTGMISGQPFRSSLPPVLSSLAAMQASPAVNVGVGAQFGGNMALLQGMNYQSLVRSQAPLQQFPAHDEFVNSQRPLNTWSPQRFINCVVPNSSAGFWGGYGHMDNGDQGSSSFNPNNHLGFNPSQ